MTNEEAIKYGIETLEYMRDNYPYLDDERKQALNLAIKALKRDNCVRGDAMEIIIGEYVKDDKIAHKRIDIPESEIEHILDVLERRKEVRPIMANEDVIATLEKVKLYLTDQQEVDHINFAIKVLEESPTGEWIEKSFDGAKYFICNQCKEYAPIKFKHCPNCGTQMQGGRPIKI